MPFALFTVSDYPRLKGDSILAYPRAGIVIRFPVSAGG
ncbi:hypothetical protein RvY_06689 [Ramazzottius varieornatus]|uniref:Uncharacterized protein n=1 Tax=Ramazzottius varieornatus TaxID=947166 RepID=A0A1D1UZF4_RAMVA|nr:hypothetical protein RvY_06689 [Ramazzottius varieornatus]